MPLAVMDTTRNDKIILHTRASVFELADSKGTGRDCPAKVPSHDEAWFCPRDCHIYRYLKESKMLLIVGTVRLSSSRVLDAQPAMEAMIMASRAEPGCIDYSYAEDVLDRGLIHVKEAWENRAALDGHFASSHIAAWRASWQSLGIMDRQLVLYEVGDPQPT